MKRKNKKNEIQKELDMLRKRHRGLLCPAHIVEYAENEKTELHNCFTWDDKKAGNQYRLWQARELIRVYVKVIKGSDEPVRAYVSLKIDRSRKDGGYRDFEQVMVNPRLRTAFLNQALEELERFEQKYKQLKELVPVFKAIAKVKSRKKAVA